MTKHSHRFTVAYRGPGGRTLNLAQYANEQSAKDHAQDINGIVIIAPYNPFRKYIDSRGRVRGAGLQQSKCSRALAQAELEG